MRCLEENGRKIQVYITSLIITIFSVVIFWNSLYWPYKEITTRKVLLYAVGTIIIIVVPILCIKIKHLYRLWEKGIQGTSNLLLFLKNNKKKAILFLGAVTGAVGLSYITALIAGKYVFVKAYNWKLFYMLMIVSILLISLCFVWKKASQKVEYVFFLIAIFMGILLIGIMPAKTGVSWDDQIHYGRALSLVNKFNGIDYYADTINIEKYVYLNTEGYDRESYQAYLEEVNKSYDSKDNRPYKERETGIYSIAYIPSAIGILVGRGLGLSYTGVFNMGRVFNFVFYIVLIFLAIRRMKYGKILVAALGLIPTTLFMAANYSYDSWVVGFTVLGYAYFFGVLQEDGQVRNRDLLIMVGALTIGCFPKAVYFPLLFPLLFIPKEKFKNNKQRGFYYALIILGGLALVGSFILPLLVQGAGSGDVRGGADVNSAGQIQFILSNPMQYAKVLLRFFWRYISLETSGGMLQYMAYMGEGRMYIILWMILAVLMFLDRGEKQRNYLLVSGAAILGNVMAIVLAITALYVSFTAVGSSTVAGVQGRYLLPVLFPVLYSLGSGKRICSINKNALTCVPLLIIAMTMVYNLYHMCVAPY